MLKPRLIAGIASAVIAAGAATAAAQVIPRPPQDQPIALVGGTIHTVTNGVIENGTLIFVGGRITAVGVDLPIPPGTQTIDISGKHVFPGLVDAFSTVGLTEIGGFDQATDLNELGDINPNIHAEVAVNPESRHIGTTRSNGVLITVASPSGGMIAGMAAAMMLEGWTWEEMTVKSEAGLIVNWPSAGSNNYEDGITALTDAFTTARAYAQLRESAGADAIDTDPRWEAMVPVFSREVPVIIDANDVNEIQDAVTWAEQQNLRMILRGGADAWYVADFLAAKQIPVLLTSVIDGPNRPWEPTDGVYGQPRRLYEAGVRFAITGSSSAAYANRLPYEAGAAIAYGLPPEEALKAVTLYPAQFLGIDDRVGSLEEGMDATLLVTTGHPLEYSSTIDQAFVVGKSIDLMDAHKRFFEKYSEKVQQKKASGGGGSDH